VTFEAKDLRILEPVRLLDTSYLLPVGVVRFFPPALNDSVDVSGWALDVSIGDSVVKNAVTGMGVPPGQIDFELANRPDLNIVNPVPITSRLVVRDTAFMDKDTMMSDKVFFVQEGAFKEQRRIVNGNYVETYNLLLFHFDSSAVISFMDEANRIMRGRIKPNSTVRIIGHTDNVGLPPYNKKLSQRRADVTAMVLNVEGIGATLKEVRGVGEKDIIYDNDLPEGRYYSRTVTVIIETPVEDDSESTEPMSSSAAPTREQQTDVPLNPDQQENAP
jgi:hypothetical protein